MIDAHAHVGDPGFDNDRDEVLGRAAAAGLRGIVCVGQDSETSLRALEVKSRGFVNLQLAATAGLHPHEAKRFPEERPILEQLLRTRDFAAVGETGLDFYYDHSPREIQRESFRWHLQIAKELLKPVVVHVRDAHAEALEDIQSAGGGVVTMIHCFSGNTDDAKKYLDLGSYISFSGILTFKTAGEIRDAARTIPADRILVETDCPFLAPIPFRLIFGRRESSGSITLNHSINLNFPENGNLSSEISIFSRFIGNPKSNENNIHFRRPDDSANRIFLRQTDLFLAPSPFRGKRCEPAFVVHTLNFLAEVRGDLKSTIADATTENALRVFWKNPP